MAVKYFLKMNRWTSTSEIVRNIMIYSSVVFDDKNGQNSLFCSLLRKYLQSIVVEHFLGQPISTCTIFDYQNNDYMSDSITDSVISGGGEGKKNKRKLTTPKRTADEDRVSGSGKRTMFFFFFFFG